MKIASVLLAIGCLVSSASAKLELAGLFLDHKVVQHDRPPFLHRLRTSNRASRKEQPVPLDSNAARLSSIHRVSTETIPKPRLPRSG